MQKTFLNCHRRTVWFLNSENHLPRYLHFQRSGKRHRKRIRYCRWLVGFREYSNIDYFALPRQVIISKTRQYSEPPRNMAKWPIPIYARGKRGRYLQKGFISNNLLNFMRSKASKNQKYPCRKRAYLSPPQMLPD